MHNSAKIQEIVTIMFIFLLCLAATPGAQTLQGIPADDPYLQMGYLNITLYGADPTGTTNSTEAIQAAVNEAQKKKLACYFPSGTYLVDDTIYGLLDAVPASPGYPFPYYSDRRKPVYIVGASNPRPVVKLMAGASGFDDPGSPKPLFWLWAKNRKTGSTDPKDEQSNICFNMVFKSVDIDLSGHAGAEGIRFAGAQGSTIEDVKILADGAFAGFHSCVGQGGGTFNTEVVGGKYGIVLDSGNEAKYPTFIGAVFKNQTGAVIKADQLWTPMLMAGFHIVKEKGTINFGWPTRGGLVMVDGIIEYTGSVSSVFSSVSRNLFLKNVYIKNAKKVYAGGDLNADEWNHVEEYNYCGAKSTNLINGQLGTDVLFFSTTVAAPPEPLSLIRKHVWDSAEFASVEMRNQPDYVNVKDAARMNNAPAIGDGQADDTAALQWALDNFKIVFLPKRIYRVTRTLMLNSATHLFGAGKTSSILRADKDWDASSEKTILKTVDDAQGAVTLSFFMIETDPTARVTRGLTRLEWHVGQNSIVRDLMIGLTGFTGKAGYNERHQMLDINGPNAGGRFYAVTGEYTKMKGLTNNPNYRHILVQGSAQPLAFYGCNVERAQSEVQMEIIDASNVSIFFLKAEAGLDAGAGAVSHPSIPVLIQNSERVNLYACSGLAALKDGKGVIEVRDSKEVTVVAVKTFRDSTNTQTSWSNLREEYQGDIFRISSVDNIALFKRNADTAVESFEDSGNMDFELAQNYPNPFNAHTAITFYMPVSSHVEIAVYDTLGRQVRLLAKKNYAAGSHRLVWNGKDNRGATLASGLYFVKLSAEDMTWSRKIVMTK